jgi:hypothetical protein
MCAPRAFEKRLLPETHFFSVYHKLTPLAVIAITQLARIQQLTVAISESPFCFMGKARPFITSSGYVIRRIRVERLGQQKTTFGQKALEAMRARAAPAAGRSAPGRRRNFRRHTATSANCDRTNETRF